jgi:uncharacterized membrane protein YkvA (DUF1232 family)
MSNMASQEIMQTQSPPDMLWIPGGTFLMDIPQQEVSLETRHEQPKPPPVHKPKTSIKQVFKQFRVIRRALVHPQVPWQAKAVAGCAFLYVVSPIQIIPNFIPIIGQMDDVLVVTLGIKYLRRYVPQSVLDECESHSRVFRNRKTLVSPVTGPLPNSES